MNKTEDCESIVQYIEKARKAQEEFSQFSQDKLDEIFKAMAKKAGENRILLAKMAVEETGMGIFEDKVIKNHYASEFIYNTYKNEKTTGIIEYDPDEGITKIAEPVGIIAALIPTTNPTSTTIFKALIALKTANAIIFAPHPKAAESTAATAEMLRCAAVSAGAPENIIMCIKKPSKEKTAELMKCCDMILATGGAEMVKAAYSSGTPAIGVGAGNVPAVIDESADIESAVNSIIHSKCFDNGVICASEQAVIVSHKIYDDVRAEFAKRGCCFLNDSQIEKIRTVLLKNGRLNADIVGKSPQYIAGQAGIEIEKDTKIIIGEVDKFDENDPLCCEKLSVVLAMLKANSFEESVVLSQRFVESGGLGHTSSIYIDEKNFRERLELFCARMKTCRVVVNAPSAQGAIGDMYNFALPPSLTLGCGSWGGNSVCENVGIKHLMNIKIVAERRENMLWFRVPERVYIKPGCLKYAIEEIAQYFGKKRAFVVTDTFLHESGLVKKLTDNLARFDIDYTVYSDVEPDPVLDSVKKGAKAMEKYKPDVIIAFGGGSAIDAAKIMWVLYEKPQTDFSDLSRRFVDIRKRISAMKPLGEKAYFAAIPTTAGTGAEVTPFAVITDEKSGIKYPVADYELVPDMAIIDANLHKTAPPSLCAAAGFDALTHAIEAYVSVAATDFSDALALYSIKLIFENLENCCVRAKEYEKSIEKLANAAAMSGMAFANAFLGVCHAMAHKLGAAFSLPHGIANALMIEQTMRFNATLKPTRMGSFSQYHSPNALQRYAQIAAYLHIKGKDDEDIFEKLIQKINTLKEKIGIRRSISEYGIDRAEFESKLDELSLNAFDDQCVGANPRYPLVDEIKQMYRNAFDGTH